MSWRPTPGDAIVVARHASSFIHGSFTETARRRLRGASLAAPRVFGTCARAPRRADGPSRDCRSGGRLHPVNGRRRSGPYDACGDVARPAKPPGRPSPPLPPFPPLQSLPVPKACRDFPRLGLLGPGAPFPPAFAPARLLLAKIDRRIVDQHPDACASAQPPQPPASPPPPPVRSTEAPPQPP